MSSFFFLFANFDQNRIEFVKLKFQQFEMLSINIEAHLSFFAAFSSSSSSSSSCLSRFVLDRKIFSSKQLILRNPTFEINSPSFILYDLLFFSLELFHRLFFWEKEFYSTYQFIVSFVRKQVEKYRRSSVYFSSVDTIVLLPICWTRENVLVKEFSHIKSWIRAHRFSFDVNLQLNNENDRCSIAS